MNKKILKMISLALSTMCFFAGETTRAQTKNHLLFPKDNYVVETKIVNATDAPVLFDIGVGGYMSVNNAQSHLGGRSEKNSRADLALAAGYVVVSPGCRGRDNKTADGTCYGKAPATIVDLKAAVCYIRYNKSIIPGNIDWIISVGCSAGGALSALLGTSGNNQLYDKYLKKTVPSMQMITYMPVARTHGTVSLMLSEKECLSL